MLPETLVLQYFQKIMLLEPLALQHYKHNVARTIGFAMCPKLMLLKQLVLQQFQN